jgi:6 kDa early secretory antigenic target
VSEIKVTFAALEGARADVAGTSQRIAAQLDDLKRYLAPLVATWEGEAATRYAETQRRWDTAAADLRDVLAQVGVALGGAHDAYRRAETANAGRWAG